MKFAGRKAKRFVSYSAPAAIDTPSADEITTETAGESFDTLEDLIGDGTDSSVKFSTRNDNNFAKTLDDDTVMIVPDPAGGDNKVLMLVDGSGSGYTSVVVGVSGSQVANGLSIFETKLFIPKSALKTGGSVMAQLSFDKGRTITVSENLNTYSDGSQVYLVLDDTTGAETDRAITADAWHTLRLEFHNSTSADSACIKVYIDGLYAGKFQKRCP